MVGDDALRARVDRACADLAPRPAVVRTADLEQAGMLAESAAGLDVVVVGPPVLHRSRLEEIAEAHDRAPGPAMILLSDTELRAPANAVVRTGAVDLLKAPSSEDLRRSVIRALSVGSTRRKSAGADAPRRVVTVASATGGCGKTFYALNLASFLRHELDRKVCVVDFDLQFGEVSSALRIKPAATIFDLVRQSLDDDELRDRLQEVTVAHESGIDVLPAPMDPADADHITPRDAIRVIRALRAHYDDVIVDTPSQLTEIVLAAFDVSDELVVMVTPDVPSVRNLKVFLETLARLEVSSDRVSVVMNKADRHLGIDLGDIAEVVGREFLMVLPYAREVSRSINRGVPVLAWAPRAAVSRQLRAGIVAALPATLRRSVREARPPRTRGIWRSFRTAFRSPKAEVAVR